MAAGSVRADKRKYRGGAASALTPTPLPLRRERGSLPCKEAVTPMAVMRLMRAIRGRTRAAESRRSAVAVDAAEDGRVAQAEPAGEMRRCPRRVGE